MEQHFPANDLLLCAPQELQHHPNIVKLHNVIQTKGNKDIYLIFDCMGKAPKEVLSVH